MKSRKGFKRFYFNDGTYTDAPISDEAPKMEVHPDPYFRDSDMMIWQDRLLQWERNQRGLAEVATRKAMKGAGEKSATVRSRKKKRLHDEWLAVAMEARRHNAAISVTEIARKIARHMRQSESDLNFDTHRETGTIENFLYKNLKKTEK